MSHKISPLSSQPQRRVRNITQIINEAMGRQRPWIAWSHIASTCSKPEFDILIFPSAISSIRFIASPPKQISSISFSFLQSINQSIIQQLCAGHFSEDYSDEKDWHSADLMELPSVRRSKRHIIINSHHGKCYGWCKECDRTKMNRGRGERVTQTAKLVEAWSLKQETESALGSLSERAI